MEWQPIETAPRTGEKVLLWTEFGEVVIGRADDAAWAGAWSDDNGPNFDAFYWMPLPQPPVT